MTTDEKVDTVKEAAQEACDLLANAYAALKRAEIETGYEFSFNITQELDGDHIGSVRESLALIADGEEDDDIKLEVGTEEETENAE